METIIQSALIDGQQSFFIVAVIFATGLLTSITPCIYPMLPITVSVVGNMAKNRKQGFWYSLIYVLGLALVYAALGLLAASTGQLFGSIARHPGTLTLVALFCLLMAMWILGWIKRPTPVIASQFKTVSAPLNVFIAGCLSGLVMAPCTSPVLGMLLMYVAGEGDPYWAALLMFVFAFGMSALLILAGSFSGFLSALPRSGPWLNASKWIMAAMMTGAAGYLLFEAFV
ncbi:MAG: sulfite exporter TauE/SafE family protein [Alteromonadaceae bacterium]|nr:sulfite exporter TauE/SafE family protein [Alteromonadaceae bacterium]